MIDGRQILSIVLQGRLQNTVELGAPLCLDNFTHPLTATPAGAPVFGATAAAHSSLTASVVWCPTHVLPIQIAVSHFTSLENDDPGGVLWRLPVPE